MTDDAALDLYALDPREFIAARDALVKQLKASGDKDAAKAVGALRKPSVPAWAMNQVVRTSGALIDELLAAAHAARQAQDAAITGGKRDELRDALARRRAAATAVTTRAREVLAAAGRSGETHERAIERYLAESLNGIEPPPALVTGQLADLEPDEGASDDLLASLTASVPASGAAPKRAERATKKPKLRVVRDDEDAGAAEREAAARAAAEAARAAAATEVANAEAAVDAAREQLRAAEAALARAEQRARDVDASP